MIDPPINLGRTPIKPTTHGEAKTAEESKSKTYQDEHDPQHYNVFRCETFYHVESSGCVFLGGFQVLIQRGWR